MLLAHSHVCLQFCFGGFGLQLLLAPSRLHSTRAQCEDCKPCEACPPPAEKQDCPTPPPCPEIPAPEACPEPTPCPACEECAPHVPCSCPDCPVCADCPEAAAEAAAEPCPECPQCSQASSAGGEGDAPTGNPTASTAEQRWPRAVALLDAVAGVTGAGADAAMSAQHSVWSLTNHGAKGMAMFVVAVTLEVVLALAIVYKCCCTSRSRPATAAPAASSSTSTAPALAAALQSFAGPVDAAAVLSRTKVSDQTVVYHVKVCVSKCSAVLYVHCTTPGCCSPLTLFMPAAQIGDKAFVVAESLATGGASVAPFHAMKVKRGRGGGSGRSSGLGTQLVQCVLAQNLQAPHPYAVPTHTTLTHTPHVPGTLCVCHSFSRTVGAERRRQWQQRRCCRRLNWCRQRGGIHEPSQLGHGGRWCRSSH